MKARSAHSLAVAAKAASRALAPLDAKQRNAALEAMARQLESARPALLAANREDLRSADADKSMDAATRARLVMDGAKLDEMIAQVRAVAALTDPLSKTLDAIELDAELNLTKISVPLGVLAVIFEARPDAVTQIAALAIKSGNAVMLKPGSEVERTASALVDVLRTALAAVSISPDAITLVRGRAQAAALLREHALIDMVIPRGSKALVEYVKANTRIPVLGHAEGVCHIYVDRAADESVALRVIEDAKCDYPAACNAVETVLIHRDIAKKFLPKLARRLAKLKVATHFCEPSRELLLAAEFGEQKGIDAWHHEYGALGVSVGVVASLDAAIAHIHQHGSAHTESILTEDAAAAEKFLREVDAAGVFHNASTRFADGFRYGFGAEVGVSTSKFHARGPVGLDGLTTYKYVLRGQGHIAADYRGKSARRFTHKRKKARA